MITVGDVKRFLENKPDEWEFGIYLVSPEEMKQGLFYADAADKFVQVNVNYSTEPVERGCNIDNVKKFYIERK